MEVTRLSREDVGGIREAVRSLERGPRILCWNCKKLTPFHEDRCEFCGAKYAGGTGGVYASNRTVTAHIPEAPSEDEELVQARRSLLQLFDDLQHVHDVAASRRYDPAKDEETLTLFQCPSCGRFVAEDAVDCACGVHFASSDSEAVCSECGYQIPRGTGACPICANRALRHESQVAYVCPVCGAEVSEDAASCLCGARFVA